MREQILVVGNDAMLQTTRVAVLARRWNAFSVLPPQAVQALDRERPAVLVICHSVDRDEARGIIIACREQFPEVRILTVERYDGSFLELNVDATSDAGPYSMIKAVENLLSARV